VGFLRTTFTVLGLAAGGYVGVSSAMASTLTRTTRVRPEDTPESVGLDYRDVSFTSRGGDARLSGWIIPPDTVAPPEQPTDNPEEEEPSSPALSRESAWVVMVHGDNSNRSDPKT
jgi:hypothetical protein